MTRISISILACLSFALGFSNEISFAQENERYNFKIVEREFGRDHGLEYTWAFDKVDFEFLDLMEKLDEMLNQIPGILDEKTSQRTEINREQNDSELRGFFSGRSRNLSLDPKGYGLKRSKQMIAVRDGPLNYDWEIEVKDDRYRVKVLEFRYGQYFTSLNWVKSDGTFRTREVYSSALMMLDMHFKEAFDYRNYQPSEDDDW
jgi:hypothetical protein